MTAPTPLNPPLPPPGINPPVSTSTPIKAYIWMAIGTIMAIGAFMFVLGLPMMGASNMFSFEPWLMGVLIVPAIVAVMISAVAFKCAGKAKNPAATP